MDIPKRVKNLIGEKSGYLVITEYVGMKVSPNGRSKSLWRARCVCGNYKNYTSDVMTSCKVTSCGCKRTPPRLQHGFADTPTYNSWNSMIQRCTLLTCHAYPTYGGVGITVCSRWLEKRGKGFLNFLGDMGERPEGTTLNRINGAKVYSKETCEWATLSVQAYDQKISCKNTSGKVGVSFNTVSDKWEAYIHYQTRRIGLGHHVLFTDAVKAREDAELKYFGWKKNEENRTVE